MNAVLYEWLIALAGNVLLFALVFGMSATVDVRSMVKQLTNVTAIMIGIGSQFFILPLLGFLVVKCFGLSQPTGLTLLVVTSSPGGSYSNWYVVVNTFGKKKATQPSSGEDARRSPQQRVVME